MTKTPQLFRIETFSPNLSLLGMDIAASCPVCFATTRIAAFSMQAFDRVQCLHCPFTGGVEHHAEAQAACVRMSNPPVPVVPFTMPSFYGKVTADIQGQQVLSQEEIARLFDVPLDHLPLTTVNANCEKYLEAGWITLNEYMKAIAPIALPALTPKDVEFKNDRSLTVEAILGKKQ